jgi:nucleoside-diphosphate-sugar epimerase
MSNIGNQLHVILGGAGAIGNAVLEELQARGLNTRAVERSKEALGFKTVKADLLNKSEAIHATRGATHVYLCVGLPYTSKVWTRDWPTIMKHIIDACVEHQAKLIFFDNVYLYGPPPLAVPFDEEHPQMPTTKKGKVRKKIADALLQAITNNLIQGVIGRSADFYGPRAINSSLYISFLERMLAGKNPRLLSATNIPHTYAYTKDNARALVMLALDESTYGEVWHLPAGEPITLDDVLRIFNVELNTSYSATVITKLTQNILGVFVPPLKEAQEMLYQFEHPYILSSQKFMNKFPEFKVTTYEDGLKEMVTSFMP